jgi:spore germination protein GerM
VSTTRRRLLAGVVACGLVAALAACGVSSDSRPRDILPDEEPSDVGVAQTASAQPGTGATVYFLGPESPGEHAPLTAVGREGRADRASLLMALLDGPTATEQDAQGLRTAIPAGTTLRSASLDSRGTLQVDVSAEFLVGAGDVLLDAVAQIVFTASEIDGVERVRLLVDGEPQDWPTSSGNSTREPLTIYDYPDRIPFSQPDYPAVPSPTAAPTTSGPPSTTRN